MRLSLAETTRNIFTVAITAAADLISDVDSPRVPLFPVTLNNASDFKQN